MKNRLLIAVLISILAAVCGSAWAVPPQAPATEIAGGSGGNPFSDPDPAQGARVVEVQVRSGDNVDSVQLVYMLGDGRTVSGQRHGGGGGGLSVFHLDADEYLTGISGRSGSYIDSIQFQTNKRTSPRFGGNGGDRNFNVSVPANARATGFVGRAGEYLDALGLTFTPIRREPSYGYGGAPQPGQTTLGGGSGGNAFFDADVPPGAVIVEVRAWSGDVVDSVQMIYALPNRRSLEGARHGGGGGLPASFRLQQGEYIIGISGRYGEYVDSFRIQTNMRTSQPFGGNGGDRDFRIDVPDGNLATGFMGRSGEYLDALGLTYARAPEQGRFRDRDRGRNR